MTELVASTTSGRWEHGTALGAAAADKLIFHLHSSSEFPWSVVEIAISSALLIGVGL
jgi:hypothetical protein